MDHMKKRLAFIFDMDGVVVNNYSYHHKAWETFCNSYGLDFEKAFRSKVFGGTNRDHLETFFERKLTVEEVLRYEDEKEALYRQLYRPHIQPLAGLKAFLGTLKNAGIPCALATSSPAVNVEFVLSQTATRDFFPVVLDASHVSKGKPHPEVYLKASASLHREPHECIVFEDSVNGITAAQAAGCRVVALSTTHTVVELPAVDLVIPDFSAVDIRKLEKLL